jgi:hypothetical protein
MLFIFERGIALLFKRKTEITFINVLGYHNSSIPVPAEKCLPEWYKQTPRRHNNDKSSSEAMTLKRCMPFFDVMTAGYILKTPCDIYVKFIDGEPKLSPAMANVLSAHDMKQGHLHPKRNGYSYPKFLNSWGIKTPKGYSCLLINPAHNPNPWFEILEGLVDTDTYNIPIHFPFILKNPTAEYLIPEGTPMVQIIPFKRDEWKFTIGNDQDRKLVAEQDRELSKYAWDRYKRLFRAMKEWNNKN